jgi:hypothetical protein
MISSGTVMGADGLTLIKSFELLFRDDDDGTRLALFPALSVATPSTV